MILPQGVWVGSLVGELGSSEPRPKKKKKKTGETHHTLGGLAKLQKDKAVLIKSLPCTLCPWNHHFSGSWGAKECKPVARPTLKSWQVRSRNTRLFQLNKDSLSCCRAIRGPGGDTKMHKAQMSLAENSPCTPPHLQNKSAVDGRENKTTPQESPFHHSPLHVKQNCSVWFQIKVLLTFFEGKNFKEKEQNQPYPYLPFSFTKHQWFTPSPTLDFH